MSLNRSQNRSVCVKSLRHALHALHRSPPHLSCFGTMEWKHLKSRRRRSWDLSCSRSLWFRSSAVWHRVTVLLALCLSERSLLPDLYGESELSLGFSFFVIEIRLIHLCWYVYRLYFRGRFVEIFFFFDSEVKLVDFCRIEELQSVSCVVTLLWFSFYLSVIVPLTYLMCFFAFLQNSQQCLDIF